MLVVVILVVVAVLELDIIEIPKEFREVLGKWS